MAIRRSVMARPYLSVRDIACFESCPVSTFSMEGMHSRTAGWAGWRGASFPMAVSLAAESKHIGSGSGLAGNSTGGTEVSLCTLGLSASGSASLADSGLLKRRRTRQGMPEGTDGRNRNHHYRSFWRETSQLVRITTSAARQDGRL